MTDNQPEQVDNWVFDSLVNFLHGSIWKAPVVGFIEEKSVVWKVFDPDSYNNMTEDKEEEFRKIHEEYKGVVDFMLTSFMEDLQVTPEQVEEACHLREHQSKTLPESHITKVALEQLWAAEDFTAFRRLMTRKNIDLQLQSLELLVAKYGVLSPSLRSGDSDEPSGEDGEDDFLQVVIRYSDQLELFKCDYGKEGGCPENCTRFCNEASNSEKNGDGDNDHNEFTRAPTNEVRDDEADDVAHGKNMRLHLTGIRFKDNVAPMPVEYQATLTSTAQSNPCVPLSHSSKSKSERQDSIPPIEPFSESPTAIVSSLAKEECESQMTDLPEIIPPLSPQQDSPTSTSNHIAPPPPTPAENVENILIEKSRENSLSPSDPALEESNNKDNIEKVETEENGKTEKETEPDPGVDPQCQTVDTETDSVNSNVSPTKEEVESEIINNFPEDEKLGDVITTDKDSNPTPTEVEAEKPQPNEAEGESQLIQLEEADAAMEVENNEQLETYVGREDADVPPTSAVDEENSTSPTPESASAPAPPAPAAVAAQIHSPRIDDEKTAAEIASTAPEQRRLLTAVRRALEVNPDDSEPLTTIDIPSSLENGEDLQKRREYLRAQRDKLIAMKKQEREKILLANTAASGPQSARPKSARAAQMAIKNPTNMRAVSLGEKSLSARRALADRLKQELIEK